MYANIVNTYVAVDKISLQGDEAVISYSKASAKSGAAESSGIVRVKPDHVINRAIHQEVVDKRQQMLGKRVQIIGLQLKGGTIIAANVLI